MNKIDELQAEIRVLQQKEYDMRIAKEQARTELIEELKAKVIYDYVCKPTSPSSYYNAPRALDYLSVSRVVNPETLAAINKALEDKGYHPVTNSDFFTGSMTYYISSDGIIHTSGGGACALDTPQICSQKEWEELKSGNIPIKLQRS